jgi:hypothetical protein
MFLRAISYRVIMVTNQSSNRDPSYGVAVVHAPTVTNLQLSDQECLFRNFACYVAPVCMYACVYAFYAWWIYVCVRVPEKFTRIVPAQRDPSLCRIPLCRPKFATGTEFKTSSEEGVE